MLNQISKVEIVHKTHDKFIYIKINACFVSQRIPWAKLIGDRMRENTCSI